MSHHSSILWIILSLIWLVEGVSQLLLLIYHIALNTSKLLLMRYSKAIRHGLVLLSISAVLVGWH